LLNCFILSDEKLVIEIILTILFLHRFLKSDENMIYPRQEVDSEYITFSNGKINMKSIASIHIANINGEQNFKMAVFEI
jgi:hypothetical protein